MSQAHNRLGAIGEHMVMAQLMQQGWDAHNANTSITNNEGVDVICINERKSIALIQVKTTKENSFPTGLTMEQAQDKSYIFDHVAGPWVFVKSIGEKEDTQYKYYVLSKMQVVNLIYESNDWYINKVKRQHPLRNLKAVCAISEIWLTGKDYEAPKLKGEIFKNPLKGISSEGAWDNIWK